MMTRLSRYIIIWCTALTAFFAVTLSSQVTIKIPLTISDAFNKQGIVWFGYHPSATYCVDEDPLLFGSCDMLLEEGLPPLPPDGVFDIRFIDSRSGAGQCLDQGMKDNIHLSGPSNLVDTFRVKFQGSVASFGAYPLTFRWPANLSQFFDSARFVFGATRINMLSQTSYTLSDIDIPNARIFIYGLKGAQTAPSSPTLTSPSNGATGQSPSLTLSWGSVPNTVLYQVEVATDSLFGTSSIVFNDTTSTTSKEVSGLTEGYKLFWRVSALGQFLKGCPSTPFSFTTVFNTPPTLVSPLNNATGVSQAADLRWRAIFGATNYHIQIYRDAALTDLEDEFDNADTTATSGTLEKCLEYYWRVLAETPYATSPYSTARKFTVVDEVPSIPVLNLPANGSTVAGDRPTLSWGGEICTRSYDVDIAWDMDFTNIISTQNVTQLSYQTPQLEGEETYYWRVRGKNGQNVYGAFSDTFSFATPVITPPQPLLILPANGTTVNDTFSVLQWRKPPNKPATYSVLLDTSANFSSPLLDTFSGLTDTSVNIDGLNYCTRYFWKVNATNTAGTSSYSPVFSFDVQRHIPGLPLLVSPAIDAVSIPDEPTLKWDGDKCSQTFTVQVSLDSTFSVLLYNTTVSSESLSIITDEPLTKYYWRVRASNELGDGSYSVGYFTTIALTRPKTPLLVSPNNNSGNISRTPTVCWDSSKRTEAYRLQVAVDSAFTTLVFNDSTLTSLCQQIGPLLYSKMYYWRVNAKNAAGTSDFSPARRFSTLFPPEAITLIDPPDGAMGVSIEPQVQWSIPDRVERYQLQVAKDAGFATLVYNDTSIQTQSWQLFDLDGRTEYYWRVRGRNAAGVGPWSPTYHFTTTIVGIANWVIPLAVNETGFGQDTIYFGFHPNATFGIDPAIGEFEMPPPFIGQFESRFISNPDQPGMLGEGLRLNLHPFRTYTQVDTFRFSFQLGTGEYPFHISWNSDFVRSVCDSMIMLDEFGGLNLFERMDLVSSADVTNLSTKSLLIYTYGALPVPTDVKEDEQIPEGFSLSQNYPNPFNPETRIEYSNEQSAMVVIGVYDVLGREISRLVNGEVSPGIHSAVWDGKNEQGVVVPSGIYYLRMIATPLTGNEQAFVSARTMILMK